MIQTQQVIRSGARQIIASPYRTNIANPPATSGQDEVSVSTAAADEPTTRGHRLWNAALILAGVATMGTAAYTAHPLQHVMSLQQRGGSAMQVYQNSSSGTSTSNTRTYRTPDPTPETSYSSTSSSSSTATATPKPKPTPSPTRPKPDEKCTRGPLTVNPCTVHQPHFPPHHH